MVDMHKKKFFFGGYSLFIICIKKSQKHLMFLVMGHTHTLLMMMKTEARGLWTWMHFFFAWWFYYYQCTPAVCAYFLENFRFYSQKKSLCQFMMKLFIDCRAKNKFFLTPPQEFKLFNESFEVCLKLICECTTMCALLIFQSECAFSTPSACIWIIESKRNTHTKKCTLTLTSSASIDKIVSECRGTL